MHRVVTTTLGLLLAIGASRTLCLGDTRPNIVMVVVDDLPDDMCNFLGGDGHRNLTPNIDRLAEEGMVLTRMHSPSPICTPSRFAILTGRYPSRSTASHFRRDADQYGQTVVQFNTFIEPGDDTLPRRLQQAGYTTAAVGKNHVIEPQGFEKLPYTAAIDTPEAQRTLKHNAEVLRQAFLDAGFDYANRLYFGNPDADGVRALAAHNQDWITEGAVEFLANPHEKPFFLYFATTIPHGPFEDDRSWNADRRITPEGMLSEPPQLHSPPESIRARAKQAGIDGWNRKALLWLDDAIGSLLAQLESSGQIDNTIVVFVSDHGTKAKGSVYDRGTNTPCFLWKRGGFGRSELATKASLVDLAPTVLDWADATVPTGDMDGLTLVPAIEGQVEQVHDTMYFEVGFSRAIEHNGLKYIALRYPAEAQNMSREERDRILKRNNASLKLRDRPVATTDPMAPFSHLSMIPGGNDAERVSISGYPSYFEADQLFDLRNDPLEQHNLFDDPAYAERLADLRCLLNEYVTALPGTFGEFGTIDFTP